MCIAAHAQMHSYSTNFTYSLKNFVDTIPIEIADNQIFVTGTVNGHPYRFCIDTGSSQGTIYDEAAAKLPLKRGQTCIYWGVWELRNRPYQN